jgi:hypothetical protein
MIQSFAIYAKRARIVSDKVHKLRCPSNAIKFTVRNVKRYNRILMIARIDLIIYRVRGHKQQSTCGEALMTKQGVRNLIAEFKHPEC